MLDKIIANILIWGLLVISILQVIPSYISYTKLTDSQKARPLSKNGKGGICASLILVTVFMTAAAAKEAMKIEDFPFLASTAHVIAAFIGGILMGVFFYCDDKCRSAKKEPLASTRGCYRDNPPTRKPQRRRKASKPMSSTRDYYMSTSRPAYTPSPAPAPMKDTSPARLLILSEALPFENIDPEDFDPDDLTIADVFSDSDVVYNFDNIDAAKAYLNTLDFGDVIIMSDHTVVMSFNGFRTKRNFAIADAIAYNYSHKNTRGKDCTIVSSYRHYVEFTYGLGKDTDFYHDLVNALIACLDYGD